MWKITTIPVIPAKAGIHTFENTTKYLALDIK
jgi:hypothetical protein